MHHDPRTALPLAQLKKHKDVQAPALERLSRERLAAIASERLGTILSPFPILNFPVLTLSARQPHDAADGLMDVYRPGRWDTTSNLIFMDPIIATGPNPGQWDGSVAYVSFKAQASGNHLVAVHFTGFETTMELRGPWGNNTAFTAATSDEGVVLALWDGNAGTTLSFTVNCKGSGLGYLESILVYNM